MKYTLEQLQAMSDDDLSRTVTELTAFLDIRECGELGEYDVYQWIEMHGISIDINNPSDMWPLIVEEGISIAYMPYSNEWCTASNYRSFIHDKNPLRAAAILYVLGRQA